MSDREKDSVADLRKVEEFAKQRKAYAWRQVRRYGRLDDALPWFAGVAAGVAGITAAIEAPAAVTASVAFASALSTAVAKPVRDRRVHAVDAR